MKKCPECGNPSYDGAPVCGNCGFKFPKPKVAAPKQESIFDKAPKQAKSSSKSANNDDQSTISILKKNKLLIGAILLITLIVICGIVLTGSNNNKNIPTTGNLLEFSNGDFSFKYPGNWNSINETDESHIGAVFFENGNNTTIEYYNSTLESSTLKEITLERISFAQESGSYVELVETITMDGRNATNIIFENADGSYTRYVSMFNNEGTLHVFKISGSSIDSIRTDEINSVLNSANIV